MIHMFVMITGRNDLVRYFRDEELRLASGKTVLDYVKAVAKFNGAEMFIFDGVLYSYEHKVGRWYKAKWEGVFDDM